MSRPTTPRRQPLEVQDKVEQFFAHQPNRWFTIRQIAWDLVENNNRVRAAANRLVEKGFLINSIEWDKSGRQTVEGDSRTIGMAFRTKAGFMLNSTFEPLNLPEVIWVGEESYPGPFCKHCGNPQTVHGPEAECLNYRVSPLFPKGDLPPAKDEDT